MKAFAIYFALYLVSATGLVAQEPVQEEPVTLKSRISDITVLRNMSVALEGHGLVTGLNNTGSTGRLDRQELINLIQQYGITASIDSVNNGGVAVVRVRATLRPWAKRGSRVDVYVSNIGDSTSLRGGDLVTTPLVMVQENGALDMSRAWVQAAGPLTVSGESAAGRSARVTVNHPTTGIISSGGQVLRDVESGYFSENGDMELQLLAPSFMTAASVATGIRRAIVDTGLQVKAVDPSMVRIIFPEEMRNEDNAMSVINLIRDIPVAVENPSTVVIDETTGMIIAGGGVLISPCVVAMSDLTISVVSEDHVVQPFPGINQGQTEVIDRTRIELVTENTNPEEFSVVQTPINGATVGDLLSNLQALKLTPRQMITVFEALRDNGFLHGKLEKR